MEYNGSRRGSVIEHNFEFGPKDSLTRAARLAAENVFKGENKGLGVHERSAFCRRSVDEQLCGQDKKRKSGDIYP